MAKTGSQPMPLPEQPPGYRWLVLVLAASVQIVAAFAIQGLAVLAGYFQAEFSLSSAMTGLVVSAPHFVPLLVLLPGGQALDRIGERRVLAVSALLLAVFLGAAAAVRSLAGFVALLTLAGTWWTVMQPGTSKAVMGWFPPAERGLAMGIRQAGLPAAGALAAAVLPAVAVTAGWRSALGLGAAAMLAVGAVFALLYREPPATQGHGAISFGRQLQALLGNPELRPAFVLGTALVSAQFVVATYLMLYLRDSWGMPLERAALVLVAAQAGGGAGRILLAVWSDRGAGGRLRPVLVALWCTAAAVVLLPLLPVVLPLWVVVAFGAVLGFFVFGWYGPWVVYVMERAPAQAPGLTVSLAININQVGIVAAPPLFGGLIDTAGYGPAWWLLAALLAAVGLGLRHLRRPQRG